MDYSTHADKINQTLDRFGGLWSWYDIVECCARGEMQMFANNGSIVVTKVADFPRKRVLDIVLAYGSLEEIEEMQQRVYEYGLQVGASMISAHNSRLGWGSRMKNGDGWRLAGAVYLKDI